MALLILKVANLVQMPDYDRFHFGYTAIEPTLNLFKSLVINYYRYLFVRCCWGYKQFNNGGNSAGYGVVMIYGAIATISCFTVSAYMKH